MLDATPRFVADAMLGRLAKWLRLLGFDTTYRPVWPVRELLRVAATENRILLTRDTRLVRRRRLPAHLFIDSDDFRSQLRQVVDRFHLDTEHGLFHRCARCNTTLAAIDADCARPLVPAYVAATQSSFLRCPACSRIYWAATHVDRIQAERRHILAAR